MMALPLGLPKRRTGNLGHHTLHAGLRKNHPKAERLPTSVDDYLHHFEVAAMA